MLQFEPESQWFAGVRYGGQLVSRTSDLWIILVGGVARRRFSSLMGGGNKASD